MTRPTPMDPVRRLLARITGRDRPGGSGGSDRVTDRELQSPEQRLLGVVARHGPRAAGGDDGSGPLSNAAASGVRTVAATDPSDGVAPAWLRRLNEPPGAEGEQAVATADATRPPLGPRRPRRH